MFEQGGVRKLVSLLDGVAAPAEVSRRQLKALWGKKSSPPPPAQPLGPNTPMYMVVGFEVNT